MKNLKKLVLTAVVAVFVLAGIGTYTFYSQNRVASIVQLDVNPSIELQVDDDGDVIRAVPLNADAEKILEGMQLKGADADTAVNAIVGSLLRNGYVDEIANSILLTVEDENTVRAAKLKQELTEEINAILSATAINAAIITQDMKETDLADNADISKGKATLIQNIVDANETYDAKELSKLSVNELNLILSNSKNKVENVVSTGNATDSAYIGRDKAKAAAFAHAGVKEADVRELDVEMDFEYGAMVYEVEFASAEYEYDYSIDAKSGEVLHSHREFDDDYAVPTVKNEQTSSTATGNKTETTKDIGSEKAKEIAFAHAGTKESSVSRLTVEKEYDDGKLEYHVEFNVGTKEYDYEISAETGKILDYDVDVDDDKVKTNATTTKKAETTTAKKEETTTAKPAETTSTDIGKEKAKAIALSHAGYAESAVTRLRVERDIDDGRIEYSVEFTANGKEYDYEISGASGKILDFDVEVEDND